MTPPCGQRHTDGIQMMKIPANDTPDSLLKLVKQEKCALLTVEEIAGETTPAFPSLGKPVVDMPRLWNCADDDRQELQRLVKNYLRDTELELGKMAKAIADGAFSEMSRLAHRSCGASATFGMVAITIPLRELEHLGLMQTMDGAGIHLAQARRQLGLIRNFFKTQSKGTG